MSWSITVAQPYGEATKLKGVDDTSSTTSAATTTISSLASCSQKDLKSLKGQGLQENVGVGDRHIKEKENVLVHFLLLDLHR